MDNHMRNDSVHVQRKHTASTKVASIVIGIAGVLGAVAHIAALGLDAAPSAALGLDAAPSAARGNTGALDAAYSAATSARISSGKYEEFLYANLKMSWS